MPLSLVLGPWDVQVQVQYYSGLGFGLGGNLYHNIVVLGGDGV